MVQIIHFQFIFPSMSCKVLRDFQTHMAPVPLRTGYLMKMCHRLYLVVDDDIHYKDIIHLSIQNQQCKCLLIYLWMTWKGYNVSSHT